MRKIFEWLSRDIRFLCLDHKFTNYDFYSYYLLHILSFIVILYIFYKTGLG